MSEKWGEMRGLEVVSVALGSVTLPEEDQERLRKAQEAAVYTDPSMGAAVTTVAAAEAMKKAVTDAKKKAEILAEASGLKITGIEIISEGGVYSYQNNIGNVYSRTTGMEEPAMEEDAGTVVQSAKLIVSASVSITFEAE